MKKLVFCLTLAIALTIFSFCGCVTKNENVISPVEENVSAVEAKSVITQIRGLDKNSSTIYNNDLEKEKEIRFISNVEGQWEIGYKVKDSYYKNIFKNIERMGNEDNKTVFISMAYPITYEDYNKTYIDTNSTFIIEAGKTIYVKFNTNEVQMVYFESIEYAKRRMLLEAYAVAFYESEKSNSKTCGYIVDRTKQICNEVGIEVFALYIDSGLSGHVIPVISENSFFYYGVQPHILSGYATKYKDYGKAKILKSWEFKQYQSDGTARLVNSEILEKTENVYIGGFYFTELNESVELKEAYKGFEFSLEDIKNPYIKSLFFHRKL